MGGLKLIVKLSMQNYLCKFTHGWDLHRWIRVSLVLADIPVLHTLLECLKEMIVATIDSNSGVKSSLVNLPYTHKDLSDAHELCSR